MTLRNFSILLALSTAAAQTLQGCYKIDSSLTSIGSYPYQSTGYCLTQCSGSRSAVFALTNGNECLCGNSLPAGGMVSESNCNQACAGYPSDNCGGSGYASVWLSGVGTLSGSSGKSGSSSSAAAVKASSSAAQQATAAPSVIYITTVQGSTLTISGTARPSASGARANTSAGANALTSTQESNSSGGGGGISAGAIAGIVVGVIGAALIGALVFFFIRRRNKRLEEDYAGDYKRQISPASGGQVNNMRANPVFDTRLEPTLAAGRNSSESLADDQDYSRRKVLRVVN